MLRLRAPVDTTVTTDSIGGAVDLPRRLVVQQAIGLLAENVLADDPASIVGRRRKIGILAREQILMVDHVAVLKAQELLG